MPSLETAEERVAQMNYVVELSNDNRRLAQEIVDLIKERDALLKDRSTFVEAVSALRAFKFVVKCKTNEHKQQAKVLGDKFENLIKQYKDAHDALKPRLAKAAEACKAAETRVCISLMMFLTFY